jgi:isoamylase
MTLNELLRQQPVQWHGVKLNAPDWSHESHTLAATARLLGDGVMLHVMNNAYWEPLAFEIPLLTPLYGSWQRIIDTSLESPEDIATSAIATTVQVPPAWCNRAPW